MVDGSLGSTYVSGARKCEVCVSGQQGSGGTRNICLLAYFLMQGS
jgi:hypothetical protein